MTYDTNIIDHTIHIDIKRTAEVYRQFVLSFALAKLVAIVNFRVHEVSREETLCRRILDECLKLGCDKIVVHNSIKELQIMFKSKDIARRNARQIHMDYNPSTAFWINNYIDDTNLN